MGDQMLRACEDFFAAETAARPVVLVLEDLQWGDLPTVRFVDANRGFVVGMTVPAPSRNAPKAVIAMSATCLTRSNRSPKAAIPLVIHSRNSPLFFKPRIQSANR